MPSVEIAHNRNPFVFAIRRSLGKILHQTSEFTSKETDSLLPFQSELNLWIAQCIDRRKKTHKKTHDAGFKKKNKTTKTRTGFEIYSLDYRMGQERNKHAFFFQRLVQKAALKSLIYELHLHIYTCVCMFVHVSVCVCESFSVCVCLCVYLHACVSFILCVYLFACASLSVSLSVYMCVRV